mgnify:FL=1
MLNLSLEVNRMDLQKVLISPKNKFWKEREFKPVSFLCPVCRIPRRIALTVNPQPIHYFQVALVTMVITLLTWSFFEWKGIVSFLPIWTAFEIIYRARVRAALYCQDCGFDTFLFMSDKEQAKKEIQNHWRKKFAEKGLINDAPPLTDSGAPDSSAENSETSAPEAPAQP